MRRRICPLLLLCLAGCLPNPGRQPAVPPGNALSLAEEFNKNKPRETPDTPLTGYDRSNETQLDSYLESIAFEVGRENLVPVLREHLRGDNQRRRLLAAVALIRHGTEIEPALQILIAALAEPEEWAAIYSAQMLPRLAPASLPAVEPLAQATNRSDAAAQSAALGVATFGLPAVPKLIEALQHQDPARFPWTSHALAGVGPLTVPDLEAAMGHENWFVRWGAAHALGLLGPNASSAGISMIPILSDDQPSVRSTAATSLQRMNANSKEVLTALLAAAQDEDDRVRSCIAVALGVLGKEDQRVVPALVSLSRDTSPDVRQAAAVGLNELGSRQAAMVPRFVEMLDDESAHVRRVAITGLGKAGPAAKAAWPKLRELYYAASEENRYGLAEALLRIDAEAADKEGISWDSLQTRFRKDFAPPPKR